MQRVRVSRPRSELCEISLTGSKLALYIRDATLLHFLDESAHRAILQQLAADDLQSEYTTTALGARLPVCRFSQNHVADELLAVPAHLPGQRMLRSADGISFIDWSACLVPRVRSKTVGETARPKFWMPERARSIARARRNILRSSLRDYRDVRTIVPRFLRRKIELPRATRRLVAPRSRGHVRRAPTLVPLPVFRRVFSPG